MGLSKLPNAAEMKLISVTEPYSQCAIKWSSVGAFKYFPSPM